MLGASGLPRRQVPMPSQTLPPQLGMCAGPCESGDGKGRSPGITWVVVCIAPVWRACVLLWACGEGQGYRGLCALLSLPSHTPRSFLRVR